MDETVPASTMVARRAVCAPLPDAYEEPAWIGSELVTESYRLLAPKGLVRALDETTGRHR